MKMKKWIAVYLISMGILLTACGKTADVNDTDKTPVEDGSSVEETATPAADEVTEETVETASETVSEETVSEENEEVKPLQLNKDCKEIEYLDMETYDYYMEYVDEKVLLSNEEAKNYPALAAALEEELNKRNNTYQSDLDSLIESYKTEKANGNDAGYKVRSKMSVKRADTVVLSILDSASDYTGGAHGIYDVYGYNYDTQTGQILKFSDVISDPVAFLSLANDKIQEPFSGDWETPATLDDFYDNYDTSIIWTIDYQGVRIYFNTYTLGSYALGMIDTEIYFSEAPELFNPRYLNIPKSYAFELESHTTSLIDINNDGKYENITITPKYDEYSYLYGADIEVDGKILNIDDTPEQYYYVSDNGKNYIFVSRSGEGGYYYFSSINLSEMKIDSDNETGGFIASRNNNRNEENGRYEYDTTKAVFTDPNKVMIATYIQFLGSMMGCDYYHIDDSARLVPDTGIYSIDMNSILTASIDIDCELVDLEGNVCGNDVIPKGTRLVVRRGDGTTYADLIEVPADADISVYGDYEEYVYLNSDLKIEDADKIYRLRGELDEYGSMAVFNGMKEYEIFGNVMYGD